MLFNIKNIFNKKSQFLRRFLFITAILLGLNGALSNQLIAQTTEAITLETALKLGGANNLTIQKYIQEQALGTADLDRAKEWWLPDIYAGIQTHHLWGSSMNTDGRFALEVDRDNLWLGLGLDANWRLADGLYQKKAADLRAQVFPYKTQAERNQILLQIIYAYYDLLNAQLNYQAYEQLAAQADTIAQQINIQVEGGLRYQSESLLAKSSLNHLKVQMLNAQIAYARSSAALVNCLNLAPQTKLVCVDSLLQPINLLEVNEALNFESIYENRPEFKGMALEMEALEVEKNSITKGLLLPELRLNAALSYFGAFNGDVIPMMPNTSAEIKQLYPTQALNIGILWRIPLGQLLYNGQGKNYEAQLAIQQATLAQMKGQINEEIIAAQETIRLSQAQMEMALSSSEYANEALQQCVQRQRLGTALPFEILQAQEIYIRARLDYLAAVANYNKAQYTLLVAKGKNL